MFQIAELIAIMALVGSVAFGIHKAWTGFKEGVAAPYIEAQKAVDKPIIDAAEKRAGDAEKAMKDAVGANESLQKDVERIQGEGARCSKEVRGWKDLADRA